MQEDKVMSKNEQKLEFEHATIYQTNENCQVFTGPISGAIFAMPGSTVHQHVGNAEKEAENTAGDKVEEVNVEELSTDEVSETGAEKDQLPECLCTELAEALLAKAVKAGWMDRGWQPLVSSTEAALLAMYLSKQLNIEHVWKVFGSLWHRNKDTLRQKYNEALNQQKSLDFQTKMRNVLK